MIKKFKINNLNSKNQKNNYFFNKIILSKFKIIKMKIYQENKNFNIKNQKKI